ncbi:hypothetical protein CRT23_12860 [Methylobacterium sp. V23]|nr:hypothetical protein CRT23_12860 [Methylobacterium sp. V23]
MRAVGDIDPAAGVLNGAVVLFKGVEATLIHHLGALRLKVVTNADRISTLSISRSKLTTKILDVVASCSGLVLCALGYSHQHSPVHPKFCAAHIGLERFDA